MVLYIGRENDSFFIEDTAKKINEECAVVKDILDIQDAILPATSQSYHHIVFNVDTFINSPKEIVDTVRKIQSVSNANIVIYAKGYDPTSSLITAFYYAGFVNYILSPILATMKEECYKSFTGYYELNGVPFEEKLSATQELQDKESTSPEDITREAIRQAQKRKYSVGVAGGVHRIGTTTQALQICKYIMLQGYSACYIEMNSSGYIREYLDTRSEDEFQFNENIGLVKYNGIDIYINPDFLPTIKKKDYDYFIYDYGCFNDEDFNQYSYLDKDLNILICGIKPFEYSGTEKLIAKTLDRNDCFYIFSFIDAEGSDRDDITEMMSDKSEKTTFAEAVFNPFSYSSKNNKTYDPIFSLTPKPVKNEIKKKSHFWKRN